jgi:hypothetical protein
MKKLTLAALLIAAIAGNADAQKLNGLKDKVGGKKEESTSGTEKKKTVKPYAKDFTDAKNISGAYYCNPAMLVGKDQFGRDAYQDLFKWEYIHEEGGNIVVKLNMYFNAEGGKVTMNLKEKYLENYNTKVFTNNEGEIWEIDTDVYALYDNAEKKVTHVFAKDQVKFEAYDVETAAAKYEAKRSEVLKKEMEKLAAKWMSNETYKEMVGKVGFISHYSKVSYNRNDIITEKKDVFMTTHDLGKPFYYRAYFKAPITAICGKDCQYNATYEMEGIKTSRVELMKKSSKWSQNIKVREADDNFFTAAYTVMDDKVWDYAFMYCIYQNKDKFADGKSFKLKVSIWSNRDGVDKDLMAEGTITLVYKNENKAKIDMAMQHMDNFLNE